MQLGRETVFVGALRSFCKSIAAILGMGIGVSIILFGIVTLMSPNYYPPKSQPLILPDANGVRDMLPSNAPVVLSIDIRGVIGAGGLKSDKIANILLDSQEDFLKGGRVKALLLQINTPGGSSIDSDTIYRMLLNYKKKYNIPVYAYVDGLCASGGMYIACAADKIYATESSLVGSVGVTLSPAFNFSEAMNRYGVSALTLTQGKDKDELNPFRPWKPDEGASIQAAIDMFYKQFVSIVSAARPKLTKDKLINEYGAHIFAAQTAEDLGYVDDGSADYNKVLQALTAAAQIDEKDRYQVVQLSTPSSVFNDLIQSISPTNMIRSALRLGLDDLSQLDGKFLYYYQP